jgi:hypothetical protein
MKYKIGDYVKVISCKHYPEMIGEHGVIKAIDHQYYRILFSNLKPMDVDDGICPVYLKFINLWTDKELKELTKDEVMVYEL